MGTNYYLERDVCTHCGRGDGPRHIGKSSVGWCFALRIYPDEGINDLPDWEPLLTAPTARIRDEYGREVTGADMLSVIRDRACKRSFDEPPQPRMDWRTGVERPRTWAEFHAENGSEPGPNGLVRARLRNLRTGHGADKHGDGTWDCFVGEFS